MRLDLAPLPYLPRSSALATPKWIAVLAAAGWALAGCGGGDDSPATPTPAQDVATAKALFVNLRSNATALKDTGSSTDLGIATGVKALGSSLQTDAVSASTAVADSIKLDQMAFALWQAYQVFRTTNINSSGTQLAACTVFQGAFPTNLGALNVRFTPGSVPATSAANAAWVGCSKNSSASLPRYRQTKVYDMGGATATANYPGNVSYLAVTRFQEANGQVTNLTVTYAGVVGTTGTVASPTSIVLKGDLPPLTNSAGKLLADHYTADLDGSSLVLASGAQQTTLTKGRFTAVPISGSTADTLVVDLSNAVAGMSILVLPNDSLVQRQVLESKAGLFATVSNGNGTLTGNLVADNFFRDETDGSVSPGRAKFVGTASVVPKGPNVTSTAQVNFLNGTLELADAPPRASVDRVVTFAGKLTLPQRPVATLDVKVTEPTLQTGTAVTQSISGAYTQDGYVVNFSGTRMPTVTTTSFKDSRGVATTISSNTRQSDVTVDGRKAGVIDKNKGKIIYINGEEESFL